MLELVYGNGVPKAKDLTGFAFYLEHNMHMIACPKLVAQEYGKKLDFTSMSKSEYAKLYLRFI